MQIWCTAIVSVPPCASLGTVALLLVPAAFSSRFPPRRSCGCSAPARASSSRACCCTRPSLCLRFAASFLGRSARCRCRSPSLTLESDKRQQRQAALLGSRSVALATFQDNETQGFVIAREREDAAVVSPGLATSSADLAPCSDFARSIPTRCSDRSAALCGAWSADSLLAGVAGHQH